MQTILCALPELPISYTSIAAIVIMLIGLILGCKRGFIKSIFGILASIGSIAAAIFITPYVGNFLLKQSFVESMGEFGPQIVNILSFVLSWIVVFIVLKLIFMLLNKLFTGDNIIGVLNRILGAIFGVASSFLTIIVLTYLINIFSGMGWAQTVINNAQVDPFGKWLFNNNLLDQILNWLATKIPAFNDFMNSVSGLLPVK